MRVASDVLEVLAAIWLAGTMFAVSRWAMSFDDPSGAPTPAKRQKILADAFSYVMVAAFLAFVGLILRTW